MEQPVTLLGTVLWAMFLRRSFISIFFQLTTASKVLKTTTVLFFPLFFIFLFLHDRANNLIGTPFPNDWCFIRKHRKSSTEGDTIVGYPSQGHDSPRNNLLNLSILVVAITSFEGENEFLKGLLWWCKKHRVLVAATDQNRSVEC